MNKLKFGDIVVNGWAGKSNPGKVLIFVKISGKDAVCMTRCGKEVRLSNDKESRITKVDALDFSKWQAAIEAGKVDRNGI